MQPYRGARRFGRFTKCRRGWRDREAVQDGSPRGPRRAEAPPRWSAPLEQRERLDVMRVRKHVEHADRTEAIPVLLDEHLGVARERSRVTRDVDDSSRRNLIHRRGRRLRARARGIEHDDIAWRAEEAPVGL